MNVKLVGSELTSFLPRRISSAVRDALRWTGYSSRFEKASSWQWWHCSNSSAEMPFHRCC